MTLADNIVNSAALSEADKQRARAEAAEQRAADAEADALRLHQEKMVFFDALLEMKCRDDRNGSLHQNYRDIIDRALAGRAHEQKAASEDGNADR